MEDGDAESGDEAKTCTECGLVVRADADVCEHCGNVFRKKQDG